jgi:hypothetical protein
MPISKENSQSIKTVYLNPQIKKPEKMYDFASGSQVGMAFGAIGGLVSGMASEKEGESMQQFAESNKIDIRKIITRQWENTIREKSRFKLSNQPNGAVLTTDIIMYGISIPHGLSSDYVPVLAINAKLVRNNQVVWQDSGRVLPMSSGMPRYKLDQIVRDPAKLSEMWNAASGRIIGEMVADLNK